MSDIKKILAQLEASLVSLENEQSESVIDAVTGNEFRTQLEAEKNKELCRFLKQNSHQNPKNAEINKLTVDFINFFEREISTQRLRDFEAAVDAEVSQQRRQSEAFELLYSEIEKMIDKPLDFAEEAIAMENEALRLESALMEFISLPFIDTRENALNVIDAEFVVFWPTQAPQNQTPLKIKKQETPHANQKSLFIGIEDCAQKEFIKTTSTQQNNKKSTVEIHDWNSDIPDWSVDIPSHSVEEDDSFDGYKSKILIVKKSHPVVNQKNNNQPGLAENLAVRSGRKW